MSGMTYLSQWLYAGKKTWQETTGLGFNLLCIGLGISSYVLFGMGMLAAFDGFATYGAFPVIYK